MDYTQSVEINAPRARVWAALANVEQWSAWTSSIDSIELLDKPLAVGSTAHVVQPKLRPATYTVTECQEGQEFTWQMTQPGITIVASHVIEGPDDGPVTVHLGVKQSGPLSAVVSLLYGRLTRRYLDLETAGLKQVSETT